MGVPSVFFLARAETPSKAIEDAVSNPNPNNTPTGYIFHGRLTKVISGPNILIMIIWECLGSWSGSGISSPLARLCDLILSSRRCLIILHKITVFASPIRKRNDPLTAAPTIPPTFPMPCSLSYTAEEIAMTTVTTTTTVLCPREKNNPQVTGSCPNCISPRVALSMALV